MTPIRNHKGDWKFSSPCSEHQQTMIKIGLEKEEKIMRNFKIQNIKEKIVRNTLKFKAKLDRQNTNPSKESQLFKKYTQT